MSKEENILGEALSHYLKYLSKLATSKVNEKKFNRALDIAEEMNLDVPIPTTFYGGVREGTFFTQRDKIPYGDWIKVQRGGWEDYFLTYKKYTRNRKDKGDED